MGAEQTISHAEESYRILCVFFKDLKLSLHPMWGLKFDSKIES